MQRGHIHKPYISHINPHKLVNKTPVSCPCGVPESLRPSSIESNRVYTCIPSMLLAEWSKQQAVHDDLSYLWIDHLHLWVYHILHILPLRTYFRVPDMSSQEKPEPQAAARGHEAEGRKSVVTRCSERIPRQQVQTCDLLWFMVDNDGEWWTMMDNDVDCV